MIGISSLIRRSCAALFAVAVVTLAAAPGTVAAVGALSQGFTTTDPASKPGTLMDLKADSQNIVELADSDRASQLIGVVGNQPLIELGSGSAQIQVVVSGLSVAFVSNINGDIKIGDKITASPISGVGMKATSSTQIVGTAESNLSDSDTTTQQIKDRSGNEQSVKIGTVQVQVNVTYYAVPEDKLGSVVPSFLLSLGSAIAGKDVSALRVLIGFITMVIGFSIVGIMLQAAIRSGIIAIGRNPLAQTALRRGLFDVSVTAVGVLVITIITIYITLTS